MGKGLDAFKIMMLVMVFWSFVFTIITYTIPVSDRPQLALITFQNGTTDLAAINQEFESAVTSQTEIPLVELGALLFYSGNIIIDLMLNFAFAIPEMFTILLNIMFLVLPISTQIKVGVFTFVSALIAIAYAIGILQFVTNLRGGQLA